MCIASFMFFFFIFRTEFERGEFVCPLRALSLSLVTRICTHSLDLLRQESRRPSRPAPEPGRMKSAEGGETLGASSALPRSHAAWPSVLLDLVRFLDLEKSHEIAFVSFSFFFKVFVKVQDV